MIGKIGPFLAYAAFLLLAALCDVAIIPFLIAITAGALIWGVIASALLGRKS